MNRDTRVPTSVTRKGQYTIRVYDEAAYRASIQQYYQDEKNTPTPARKNGNRGTLHSFPKQKTRFRWASPIAQVTSRKGA
jgi:hypothetical protein